MTLNNDIHETQPSLASQHVHVLRPGGKWIPGPAGESLRLDSAHPQQSPELLRWPQRLTQETFYPVVYPLMLLSRRLEQRILELFQKGYVKGTVTISIGNEATAIGMSMPLRPRRDVVSLLHRDFGAHLLLGATPGQLLCQYLANADSPTHGSRGECSPRRRRCAATADD